LPSRRPGTGPAAAVPAGLFVDSGGRIALRSPATSIMPTPIELLDQSPSVWC
jgi:hypothetical protein